MGRACGRHGWERSVGAGGAWSSLDSRLDLDGKACLANARRCRRTHCKFTGPFYLLMALVVVAMALGALPLGEYGWHILGGATGLGTAVLWWGTERVWGAFSR
jgi:hypothetical protein